MSPRFRRLERPAGQPLVVLAVLLGGWLVVRAMLWQPLFNHIPSSLPMAATPLAIAVDARPQAAVPTAPSYAAPAAAQVPAPYGPPLPGPFEEPSAAPLPLPFLPAAERFELPPQAAPARSPATRIGGRHLLLAAPLSRMELPPEIATYFEGASGAPAASDRPLLGRIAPARESANRWSGDAWLLWRGDGKG